MIRVIVWMFVLMGFAQAIEYKRSELVGEWHYVETYSQFADGTRAPQFGPKPVGVFVILPNGRYSHIIMNPDLPTVKSDKFKKLTGKEAQAIASNVLVHFGTWTAQEKEGTFKVLIEQSSFANIEGRTQVRTIKQLDNDTLIYINDLSVAAPGAIVYAHLRRVSRIPME